MPSGYNMKNNRVVYADLLRIFAAFCVIINHIPRFQSEIASFSWQIDNVFYSIVRFDVPVFIMLSGMFNLRINNSNNSEYGKFLKKSLQIAVALVFWSILNILSIDMGKIIFKGESMASLDLMKIPAKILSIDPWSHLWYLYLIIGLYLFTPLLKVFIKNASKKDFEYWLLLYASFGLGSTFYNAIGVKLNEFCDYLPYFIYFPFLELTGYLGYYIAGYYFSTYKLSRNVKIFIYITALISLFTTIIGTSAMSRLAGELNLELCNFALPTTMFISFAVFIAFKDIFEQSNFIAKQQNIIKHFAGCTFGIYLSHWIILNIFKTIGFNYDIFNPLLSIPLLALFVMLCSYLATLILQKIPKLRDYVV
jgi:surface polysaccharide O-acyltransferase-like enzyme